MEKIDITLLARIPVCSYEHFAHSCGVTKRVVEGWAEKGYIPTTKIGKRTLINLVKFKEELLRD